MACGDACGFGSESALAEADFFEAAIGGCF
jgi:hypothetical protein